MKTELFNAFSPVTSKQWKQRIQFDLNGADYNDTLVWNTNEDIAVKPFYHAEDLANLPETITSSPSHWHICETIYVADVIKSKDRKSTRLNSSHVKTSYAVFCLKKKRR